MICPCCESNNIEYHDTKIGLNYSTYFCNNCCQYFDFNHYDYEGDD